MKRRVDDTDIMIASRYLKKSGGKVFKDQDLLPYRSAIDVAVRSFIATHSRFMRYTGYDMEDLKSVANLHLCTYLSIFDVRLSDESMDRFVAAFQKKNGEMAYPSEKDVLDKNIATFVLFLKQRFSEMATKIESRTLLGIGSEKNVIYLLSNTPIKTSDIEGVFETDVPGVEIINKKQSLALRKQGTKISQNEYLLNDGRYLRSYNSIVFCRGEDRLSVTHAMSEYRPDKILMAMEEELEDVENLHRFQGMAKSAKRRMLTDFIKNNKNNDKMKDSVVLARKILIGKTNL